MFREAEIGADVLPDLTDADVGQLDIPLANSKRLLKAISSLCATETVLKPANLLAKISTAAIATRSLARGDRMMVSPQRRSVPSYIAAAYPPNAPCVFT
jgi:hypothetical protein